MNDADLGETFDQETEEAENSLSGGKRFQNDNAHLEQSRWWFASSAFPMIAGTLGPVASAFSICALVRPWRQRLIPGQDVQNAPFVTDPPWLTIINAIQLAVAIISNMFLLLNMARRIRFSIAQPVTVIGWYISSVLLIALTATASGPLFEGINFPANELMWSQAFYYGIWAAILYFIVASLMLITFSCARMGYYPKDFILTRSQRTLMLQTILFLLYLLLGALVFSNVEDWNYLDAVYWADVTLFTVGFGDICPNTALGRALVIPYALIGIISLGLVIGSIRSLVLERGRRRMEARVEEKRRRKMVKTLTNRGKDEILEPITTGSRTPSGKNVPATTEFERRQAEFCLMRKVQNEASRRRRWFAMAISTGTWLILWLVGAVVFRSCEKPYQSWTYFEAFYFCFTALTTIGYGDITPISNAGKSFFVFWSLMALPTMTVLISNAGDTVIKFVKDATIHLGTITILPGELGAVPNLKYLISKVTSGRVFPSSLELVITPQASTKQSSSPLTKPDKPHLHDEERGRHVGHPINNHHPTNNHHASYNRHHNGPSFTSRLRRSLSLTRDPHKDLPEGASLHYLLISEIQVLISHLKESTPRRYSFAEWAWYLKLIGEDERNAETHRKARPRDKRRLHKRNPHDDHPEDEDDTPMSWSWVGHRSPLMGSQEESEWILERLMDKLKESLAAERKGQGDRGVKQAHKDAQAAYHMHQ